MPVMKARNATVESARKARDAATASAREARDAATASAWALCYLNDSV